MKIILVFALVVVTNHLFSKFWKIIKNTQDDIISYIFGLIELSIFTNAYIFLSQNRSTFEVYQSYILIFAGWTAIKLFRIGSKTTRQHYQFLIGTVLNAILAILLGFLITRNI